jgi:molybdopterin converting factor subunit 1
MALSRILLMMEVRVLYFGVLKESLGRESESVELADGASVADLMKRYVDARWARSVAVAVNREYARLGDVLHDGDEVALLPPVSGGCPGLGAQGNLPAGSVAQSGKMRGFLGFARNDTSSARQAGVVRRVASWGDRR